MSRSSRAASLTMARKVPGTQRAADRAAMSNSRVTVMGSPRGALTTVRSDADGVIIGAATPVDGRALRPGERVRHPKRNTLANRRNGGYGMNWRPGVSAAYGVQGHHGR